MKDELEDEDEVDVVIEELEKPELLVILEITSNWLVNCPSVFEV